MPRKALVAALWIVTMVLAYVGLGEHLADRIEGMDPVRLPLWPSILAVAVFIVTLGVTLRAPRKRGLAAEPTSGRRAALVGIVKIVAGTAAAGAAVMFRLRGWVTVTKPAIVFDVPDTDPNPAAAWASARIEAYRRLGRTGFEVSDVSLGSGRIREDNGGEQIAREAIERGVNYFDTAPDYSGSGSERARGKALQGHRDKMFLATKWCTPDGHLPAGASVADYMGVVEASLERLRTDYVDLVHIHSCDSVERLLDPNVHEAFDRLKEQGKARFLGVSTHTPNLEIVADAAVHSGRFDVMMLAYHYGAWPKLGEIIHRAREKDMGIVAMKTLKGAKHHGLAGFRDEQNTYAQAAFKWVLSNPEVSCLVISFFDPKHVNEYLAASGKKLTDSDVAVLRKYDGLVAGTHCRPHCGACLDSCPEDLAIDDVLRYRMYAEDYGWPDEGRRLYARLDKQASVCVACPAPCTGVCPDGIAIRERMIGADRMLG
jgi:uncharacterized protein